MSGPEKSAIVSNQDNEDDKKNILHFPDLGKRKSFWKDKKRGEKEAKKLIRDQEALEEKYRKQYRAEQAQKSASMARIGASGKVPFFNWHKIPTFTRLILGTVILVQIMMTLIKPEESLMAIYLFGFIPAVYTGGLDWSWTALISPLTSLIIHGGWMHLLFNLVMLTVMGVFFEQQYGAKRTAIIFFGCGLMGNLFYFIFSPFSTAPVIGASGAISGLFAFAIMTMISSGMAGPVAQSRGPRPFIAVWLLIIVGLGLLSPDLAWQAHLGGFLSGVGLYYLRKKGMIRL